MTNGTMTPIVKNRVQQAMRCSGTDLDVFDFYRSGDGYGTTTCPYCSRQADLHRWERGVRLICTKCIFEAKWTCESEKTDLGGLGSIHLVWGIY